MPIPAIIIIALGVSICAYLIIRMWVDVNKTDLVGMEENKMAKETTERYKPIILQEHDAEPRRLRAILDTATDEIYVCKLTRQGAEILGMTIEEVKKNDE